MIDDREQAIRKQLEIDIHKEITYNNILIKNEHLTIGDFAIAYKDKIIAIIERKTISDYAASIKDGRHKNKQKMLNVDNADIYYIVEGELYDGVDKIAGIPRTTIISSVMNLMTRDKIFVINTDSILSTINRLTELAKSYQKHYLGGEPLRSPDIDILRIPPPKKTHQEILINILLEIPYITTKNINRLNTFSILDLLSGKYPVKLPKKSIEFIKDGGSESLFRLLKVIPGISNKRAKELSIKKIEELPVNIQELLKMIIAI